MYKISLKKVETETMKVSEKFFITLTNSKREKLKMSVFRSFSESDYGSGNYEIDHFYYDLEDKELHADDLEKFLGVDEDIDQLLEDLHDLEAKNK